MKALQALIRRVKPDLVHTHGALSGRIAAKRCHVPVVYSRHSAFPVPAKLKYPPGRWRWRKPQPSPGYYLQLLFQEPCGEM